MESRGIHNEGYMNMGAYIEMNNGSGYNGYRTQAHYVSPRLKQKPQNHGLLALNMEENLPSSRYPYSLNSGRQTDLFNGQPNFRGIQQKADQYFSVVRPLLRSEP